MGSQLDWRIYYADGSTADSNTHSPSSAPPRGVICIVMPWNGKTRPIAQRSDRNTAVCENWYFFRPSLGEWWGCDREGLLDQLMHEPEDTTAVKQGVSVSRERFAEIMAVAVKDPDFQVGA